MEKHKIRNSLLGLLVIGLLTGMAQEGLAQRSAAGNDVKRPNRTVIKKDKIAKQSHRQTVQKNRPSESAGKEASYARNDRKKQYRDSKRDGKSYARDRKYAYNQRERRQHIPIQKTWRRGPNRRPAWLDYHRPGYRYPRIGMHVSVLPYGHISFVLGKLRFFAYGGVYYRYDPALRLYFVVNKPRIETWHTSAAWDRIILMDGSTIEGVYRYSDNDIVFFGVGDALLEIPMSEIKVMYLSED